MVFEVLHGCHNTKGEEVQGFYHVDSFLLVWLKYAVYCENQAAHKDHDDLKNSVLVKFSAGMWCRQDQKNSAIKNALRLGRARSLSRPSSFAFILTVYSRSRVFLIAGRSVEESTAIQSVRDVHDMVYLERDVFA